MEKSRLEQALDFMLKNRKMHISIHDFAGINSVCGLKLPGRYLIHDSSFCNVAKTTKKGHNLCIKCKAVSVMKCVRIKEPYVGRCFLGVRQVIYPVIHDGTLVCIIYIGNTMMESDGEDIRRRTGLMQRRTGVLAEKLHREVSSLEVLQSREECFAAAQIVRDVILSVLNEKKTVLPPAKSHIVSSVAEYCNQYYSSNLKLSLLAKTYFINPDYLSKLFKREIGCSFSDYLNRIRVERAAQLVRTTGKKIIEIAFEVGYESDTYFIRRFKRVFGITPNEYRNSIQKK